MKRFLARLSDCLFAMAVGCTVVAGCDSRELTRSRAARLIEGSQSTAVGCQFPFEVADKGESLGLWTFHEKSPSEVGLVATAKGKAIFFFNREGMTRDVDWWRFTRSEGIWLYIPVRYHVVSVTGIAKGPVENFAEIEFQWTPDFNSVPAEIRQLGDLTTLKCHKKWGGTVETVFKGDAAVQLFDDGWRIVQQIAEPD
jgi:hypothetical protein